MQECEKELGGSSICPVGNLRLWRNIQSNLEIPHIFLVVFGSFKRKRPLFDTNSLLKSIAERLTCQRIGTCFY